MILLKNLKKSYKNNILFQNVNLEFRSNKISFVLGKNGVGKTSLIKCLFGLEDYEGNIMFDEKNIDQVREKCWVIWDDTPFYTEISGLKNLYIFSCGKKTKSEIYEIASRYLDNDVLKRPVSQYSYGQRKKLSLVLVEILSPKYLVMDEISNGLDYETICFLKKKIKDWSENMDIILTGHQFDFYNDLIDDLYVFEGNNIR